MSQDPGMNTIGENTAPPTVLDYGKSKPLGYRATQKLTRFFPITALPNTDMVRFIINSQGFWDPYSSYLKVTVKILLDNATPISYNNLQGCCQLDNSASSLIQTFNVIQNGVEIERIDRYEVLASILNDAYYSSEQRAQRSYEGFGSGITATPLLAYGRTMVQSTTPYTGVIAAPHFQQKALFTMNKLAVAASGDGLSTIIQTLHLPVPREYFGGAGEPVLTTPINPGGIYDSEGTMTFCIPIISGIFGVLMPADEIKYVPMQFFPNLEMNFKLNPYAFHNLNPSFSQTRNFQVTNCELFVNIIFFENAIDRAIRDIVRERGMYLHTNSYYYGPSAAIDAGLSFQTYPINMSFKSLRSLIWCFLPTDYRSKAYVRELRRKALAVTSAQCRIGGELYPTFPIGNGTSVSDLPHLCSEFLANFYKACGRLHDTINDSIITCDSFCCGNDLSTQYSDSIATTVVNQYNMVATGTGTSLRYSWPMMVRGFAKPTDGAITAAGAIADGNSVFMDTTVNNYLINQIVPRAVFGIDLDTITSDNSVISGVNTLINKPFELILEGTNSSKDPVEINIFLLYDFIVMIDTDFTVKYLGRGG